MWPRTFIALILGLLISMSYALNLNLLLPFGEDVLLMTGLIIAFPLWAGAMVWAYSFIDSKKASKAMLLILSPSLIINIILLANR